MEPLNLTDHKVAKGKIFKYGTLRLLFDFVIETQIPNQGGLHFSPALVKYGQQVGHTARVNGNFVEVLDAKGRVVEFIPGAQLKYVNLYGIGLVTDSGFLDDLNLDKRYIFALAKAERGEKPDVFDNSSFVKVDKSLAGQKLYVLRFFGFSDGKDDKAKAFTIDGQEEVACTVEQPLAYEKWGEKLTPW